MAMYHRFSVITTYGLNGLMKVNKNSVYVQEEHGTLTTPKYCQSW